MTVTAAFLVKDPPLDRLALLLAYLRPVVGEVVIVVDDRTANAATMATWPGVKLVPFTWCDDFAAARNAALPHCTGDWILHLDPDELPSAAMLDFIRAVDAEPQADVEWQDVTYHAPRGWLFFTRNWFDGVQAPELEEHWHCRLFRRTAGRWYKRIHEQIALEGFPEEETRGTPGLPKAPLAAHLLHSRMNDAAIDAAYARIEGA